MTRRFLTEAKSNYPQRQPTFTILVTYLTALLLRAGDVVVRITVVLALSALVEAFFGVPSWFDESGSSYSARLVLGVADFRDRLLRRIFRFIIGVVPLTIAIRRFASPRFRYHYAEFIYAFQMRPLWGARDVLAGALIAAIPAAVGVVAEAIAGALLGVKETSSLQTILPIPMGLIGVVTAHKYYARKEKEVRTTASLLRCSPSDIQ